MFFLKRWYLNFFYKPFYNFAVTIYSSIAKVNSDSANISLPIIIYAVFISIIFVPIILAARRNVKEKKTIELEMEKFKDDETGQEKREYYLKKAKQGNKIYQTLVSVNIFFQFIAVFVVRRFVKKGISGKDTELLYHFVKDVPEKFNTFFMGKYDLTRGKFGLNLILALMVFLYEGSDFIGKKTDVGKDSRLILGVLPIVTFLVFSILPSATSLFMIISIGIMIVGNVISDLNKNIVRKWDNQSEEESGEEEE